MNKIERSASTEKFKNGELSIGQLANKLGMNKHQTLKLIGKLDIPFADYELAEDLETLNELFPNIK